MVTGEEFARMLQNKNLEKYYAANKEFISTMTKTDKDFFSRMATGQAPKFLWIGCSDARIPANELVGLLPGELFVHRNVANQVVNTDNSLMAILQFSIEYLGVQNIIVAGHYGCGGVKASMSQNDHHAPLENWVRQIRDVQRIHKAELDKISDPVKKERRLIELNTLEQACNVYKEAVVQRKRCYTQVRDGSPSPRIFAMVVDPASGELSNLNFDPDTAMNGKLRQLYEVYDVEDAKKSYNDVQEPYRVRPSSWRKRRMYNRTPVSLSSKGEDSKLANLFDRLDREVDARKRAAAALDDAMAQLKELKKDLKL